MNEPTDPAFLPAAEDTRQAALFATLASIPTGKVVGYGQLAEIAGLGRAARWVGRTLARLPEGSSLPWHRVVRSDGRLALPEDSPSGREQCIRLQSEGVFPRNGRVDMRRHGWHPGAG